MQKNSIIYMWLLTRFFFIKIKNSIDHIYFIVSIIIDIKAKKMPKKNLNTDNL
jgi:hypothetical protein